MLDQYAESIGRVRFFSDFALRNLSAFRPHFRFGHTLGKRPGTWRNVGEHCLAPGIFAELIALTAGHSADSRRRVVHSVILHDWYKQDEVVRCKNALAECGAANRSCDREAVSERIRAAIDLARASADNQLRAMGYAEEVIRLASSNVIRDLNGPRTAEEMIVFYVDQILQGARVFRRRRGTVRRTRIRLPWIDCGANPFGQLSVGNPLAEVEERLTPQIARSLAEKVGFDGPAVQLPFYLQQMLENSVDRQARLQ